MLLELSSDQEFFRETTARYLTEHAPVAELRRRRHDPVGFDLDYWRRGADLGWTSLLIAEDHGGGSISGEPVVDLTLVAHEFGWRAAPGPLVTTNVVAAALSAAGSRLDLLSELVAGTAIASWCLGEPGPGDALGDVSTTITLDGSDVVVDGAKRPVEAAGVASHLLVTGRATSGLTQVLVPTDTPGVSIESMSSVDLTRRFSAVNFDGVRLPIDAVVGEMGGADAAVERQIQLALVILNAEAVGAMQRGFDMTVEWAFDRYSFGRPLASYQALKHRFADMKTWLEASHAISDAAAAAVASDSTEAAELTSVASAYIGQYGSLLLQDCVQLHGGIGVTFEHDLHLFLRRHTLNRTLFGTPADHRQRIAAVAARREAKRAATRNEVAA